MSREHLARDRPPQYYNPAAISAMPQWASAPFSPSPTPPRQPVVYLTGNHVVPNVGLGTTVVSPPIPAVAAGGSAVVAPTTAVVAGGWGVVAPTMAVIPLGTNPTTVVIPLGTVRERVAALESAAVAAADPNSGDLEMELDSADPNSPDSDWDVGDDIFRRQRPHRLIMAHLYNTDEDE